MIAAVPLATTAISSLLGAGSAASTAATAATSSSGDSFASMLASFSKDTIDSLKASESASISGIQGKMPAQSVVEAMMSAQESLQTVIAVRDKAVAAFQDLSRMAI